MSRWRVVESVYDDSFGYAPEPGIDVVKDWLTRAEAKSIYRHYCKMQWKEYLKGNTQWINTVTYLVEVLTDEGNWREVSQCWAYDGIAEQEQWFEDMGWDYMAWQMHTKEEPYDFKNQKGA